MNSFFNDCLDLSGEEYALPSEDIWKKFDALFTPPNSPVDPCFSDTDDFICKVRCELKHDCMWSGTCDSEEHSAGEKSKTVEFAVNQTMAVPEDAPQLNCDIPPEVVSELGVHSGDHTYGNKAKWVLSSYPGLLTPTDSEEDETPDHHLKTISLNDLNKPVQKKLQMVLKSVIKKPPRQIGDLSQMKVSNRGAVFKLRLPDKPQSVLSKSVLGLNDRFRSNSVLNRTNNCKQFPMKKLVSVLDPKMVVKKSYHNGVEKLRRIEIKRHFDDLRATIPDIQDAEKTSKIVILNEAKSYIERLHSEDASLARELDRLKYRNAMLAGRLKALQY